MWTLQDFLRWQHSIECVVEMSGKFFWQCIVELKDLNFCSSFCDSDKCDTRTERICALDMLLLL